MVNRSPRRVRPTHHEAERCAGRILHSHFVRDSKGGLGGLRQLAKVPGAQDALRFMALVSKQLRQRKGNV